MRTMRMTKLLPIVAAIYMAAVPTAQAQDYPSRPVQVIVPFAGGSASDVVTRILLHEMSKSLGQNFIIDNRPGAGGNTGTAAATKLAPDGYTLFDGTIATMAINPSLYKQLPYNPVKDFAPIIQLASAPNVLLVNPSLPARTLPGRNSFE